MPLKLSKLLAQVGYSAVKLCPPIRQTGCCCRNLLQVEDRFLDLFNAAACTHCEAACASCVLSVSGWPLHTVCQPALVQGIGHFLCQLVGIW